MDQLKTAEIYRMLASHWKKLLVVALVAIGVSAFVSSPWIIAPRYKSLAVVFPSNLNPFSEESATEQLLQFCASEEVKAAMARRFDLYKQYRIDTAQAKARSYFNAIYHERFRFSNTLYESIDVEVIDESPERARAMNRGLLEEVNSLVARRKKEKVDEYLRAYSASLAGKRREIDSLEARMRQISQKYGLVDVKAQAKALARNGAGSEAGRLLQEGMRDKSGELDMLQEALRQEFRLYREIKKEYDKHLMDSQSRLSFMTVVSQPTLPDHKCYPLRWAIVLGSTLSALLLACALLVLMNRKP